MPIKPQIISLIKHFIGQNRVKSGFFVSGVVLYSFSNGTMLNDEI